MEDSSPNTNHSAPQRESLTKTMQLTLLLLNGSILGVSNVAGPILLRLYFVQGGSRKWLSAWLQVVGWPLSLLPFWVSYIYRRDGSSSSNKTYKLFSAATTPSLIIPISVIGTVTGFNAYMAVYGPAYLPVSTSSLLMSSQLAFNAFFSFFLVKQRFTFQSVNAIFLLTLGAVVLGIHNKEDKPLDESRWKYLLGFLMTIAAALLFGLVLSTMELTYIKAKRSLNYTLVLETQIIMNFFATIVTSLGMILNNDFELLPKEAREFKLGEAKYYAVLVGSAVMWELFNLGTVGVISCSSSLHASVILSSGIPVTQVLGVVFFNEKFTAEKGVCLVLSVWGFASYFHGEWKKIKTERLEITQELSQVDDGRWSDGFLAEAAGMIAGKWLKFTVEVGSVLSAVGMYEALLSSRSFQLLGTAELGFFPRFIVRWSERFGTPWVGILTSGVSFICNKEIISTANVLYGLAMVLSF